MCAVFFSRETVTDNNSKCVWNKYLGNGSVIFMQVNVLFLIQKIFLMQNHPQISVIHWKNVFGSQTKCEMCGNFEIYEFLK